MRRLSVNRIYQNELTKSKDIKYMYKRDAIEKVINTIMELKDELWLWTVRTIGLYRSFIICI